MSRRRVEYPGAFYHVIQRGNNRDLIFRDEADYYRYLSILTKVKAKDDFLLLGYALMGNHYHLLLRTGETPLQQIIFYQNMLYSRYFNKRHNRSGHLYDGRCKALLILDERYLFSVLRYIHWNPCKAGLCQKPQDYSWSSDSYYRDGLNGIVNIDWILNLLNPDRKKAIGEYSNLVKQFEDIDYDTGKFIGEDAGNLSVDDGIEVEVKPAAAADDRPTLDQILKGTGVGTSSFYLIKAGSRQRRFSDYKKLYYHEAIKQGYTLKEIGANIGLSAAAVAKSQYAAY